MKPHGFTRYQEKSPKAEVHVKPISSDSFPLEKQLRIIQAKGHEIIALVEKVEGELLNSTYGALLGKSHGMFFLSHLDGEKKESTFLNIYFKEKQNQKLM